MSDKVWITARSEFIPFEKLTDKHLDNAIAWCDIRLESLKRVKPDPRINYTATREWGRVRDLKADLKMEAERRIKETDVRVLDVVFNFPATVNGVEVSANTPHKIQLARGGELRVVRAA